MKIGLRLTLWYFSITLAIVLVFSLGTYWGMRSLLFRAIDGELNLLADSIERTYDPFFNEFIDLMVSPGSANRYLEYYVIVYNASGKPVFVSPMTQVISLDIPLSHDSVRTTYTVNAKLPEKVPFFYAGSMGKVAFRAVSRPMYFEDQQIGQVIVGVPIERFNQSLEKLLWVLLAGIGLTGALVGGGGYFLTRQMLNPIHKITEKADQISHSNLGERITVHHKEDELGQLSIVLNNLLERLQKAFDSQQQFMADAAHELKTPLAILRAHWEGELNNPGLPHEMKEKLVGDIETISRLNHLINNLLMLTQTEAPDSNLDLAPLELDKLLREVISDADILAKARGQEILIEELSPSVVRGDRGRLYQLFFNLVDNASKYTPEGGKIWVSLRLEDRWALAEIRDNGPGIPAEDLPHIFKRFYRVKKDRARKTGGSGLGLAICQLITESHGGAIGVESTIGAGSTFRVKLPLAPVDLE